MRAAQCLTGLLLALGVTVTCAGCGAQSVRADVVLKIEPDVIYDSGLTQRGSKPLLMDIYQRDEPCDALKPLVLIIHGGAFRRGSKTRNGWDHRARDAARRGYVASSIDYRLISDAPVISDEFEPVLSDLIAAKADLRSNTDPLEVYASAVTAAIEDTVAALRFLESNSPEDRCIDMSRIGLWGGSAGAIVALHVAYGLDEHDISIPRPDVVIDYWGMMYRDDMMAEADAPLFILHGSEDDRVNAQNALDLKAEADAVGVGAALYLVVGAGHGYSGIAVHSDDQTVNGSTLLEMTLNFLDAHLKDDAPRPVYERVSID